MKNIIILTIEKNVQFTEKSFMLLKLSDFIDNASTTEFANNKFAGSIVLQLLAEKIPVLTGADAYITKRGKFFFERQIQKFGPVAYIILGDNTKFVKAGINHTKIDSLKDLSEDYLTEQNMVLEKPIAITVGLEAFFKINNKEYTCHCTCGYNILISSGADIPDFSSFLDSILDYTIISISNGGMVVWLKSLNIEGVKYPHLTINTNIKSVLSSNVIEKFTNDEMEFLLSDIDPKCKSSVAIKLEEILTDNSEAKFTKLYAYAI